ncbi:hypothetical protein L1987_48310 [Smallanthus sonchifolius]|uniref:Uncharacterized protein n=1 Tax=Smallanthus sonchifolius TaxID=185202 RepID=A0ACB9FSK3_9ASTR|nr:hypothetical protein L1987_48310 [Smallanthus sonchifolius]
MTLPHCVANNRVQELAGDHVVNLIFHKMDIRDKPELEKLFASTKFDDVIHFAGLKAVGESVPKTLMYYDNNIVGTLTLLQVMEAHGYKKIVFSSSATVYENKIMPANLADLIPNASLEAIDLIKQLCWWDPLRRPTAEECLQHPFFYKHVDFSSTCGSASADNGQHRITTKS